MRLLDTFCGAGGCTRGYQMAGFEVVGVDIKPQPHYIGEHFIKADVLDVLYALAHGDCWPDSMGHDWHLGDFDAIHASPPCPGYSVMNNLPWLRHNAYPYLLLPVREMLEAIAKPYVIENVAGARYGAKGLGQRGLEAHGMQAGWLCGTMFGLQFYRHRLFETPIAWLAPGHPKHRLNLHPRSERYVYGGTVRGLPGGAAGLDVKPSLQRWQNGISPGIEHVSGWRLAAEAMGIDWMNRAELTQAIPPVFTQYIGRALRARLGGPP